MHALSCMTGSLPQLRSDGRCCAPNCGTDGRKQDWQTARCRRQRLERSCDEASGGLHEAHSVLQEAARAVESAQAKVGLNCSQRAQRELLAVQQLLHKLQQISYREGACPASMAASQGLNTPEASQPGFCQVIVQATDRCRASSLLHEQNHQSRPSSLTQPVRCAGGGRVP